MHCPNCGKKVEGTQKYCRSCGMDLTPIPQLVAQHLTTEKPIEARKERDQAMLRRVGKTLFAGLAMFIVGLALLGLGKKEVMGTVGLIVVLLGTLTAAYAVTSPLWQAGFVPKSKNRITNELAESPAFLPEQREPVPVPSVTEPTTKLLGIDAMKSDRSEKWSGTDL